MFRLLLLPFAASALISQAAFAQTLEETQRLAVLNHPSLENARLEIDIAQEGLISAQAARSFKVSVGLSSALQSIGTDRAFAIDIGETLINQLQIEAVLPLYTSGELDASRDQAKMLIDASENAYDGAKQNILLAATIAHLNLVEANEAVDIRKQNMDRLQKQWDAASERFEVGVLTKTDVALAEARFQAARAGYVSALADQKAAIAAYVELTGKPPELLSTQASFGDVDADAESLIARAMAENPNLLQLRKLETVASLGVDAARSQRKIKVEAFGSAGIQDGSWKNHYEDTSATLGVRASKSLYSSGSLLSAERTAISRLEQARVQTRLAENQLLRDLSSAIAREQAARSGLDAADKEVQAARIALDGAEIEVGVGLKTTLDLLDQEQDYLDAQLRLINAQKNVYIARSQIHALLGDLGAG